MSPSPLRSIARLAVVAMLAGAVAGPVTLIAAEVHANVAFAAVRDQGTEDQQPSAPRGANALQDAAERAGQIGRVVALSMIGLALAAASVMLIFRRDFKEAAGIFAVGLLAVLLATPSGLNLLRNTAALIFGGQ
jgi:hypothetical protein